MAGGRGALGTHGTLYGQVHVASRRVEVAHERPVRLYVHALIVVEARNHEPVDAVCNFLPLALVRLIRRLYLHPTTRESVCKTLRESVCKTLAQERLGKSLCIQNPMSRCVSAKPLSKSASGKPYENKRVGKTPSWQITERCQHCPARDPCGEKKGVASGLLGESANKRRGLPRSHKRMAGIYMSGLAASKGRDSGHCQ